MKIVIIKNFYNPYIIGGAELNVENIAKSLSDNKVDVVVVCMGKNIIPKVEYKKENLKIYRFFTLNFYFPYPPKKKRNKLLKLFWWVLNLWNPYTFFVLRKILKKENPDLVQIHNFYGFSISVFTAVMSLRKPILFFPHDFYLVCKNSSFMKNNGELCNKQCLICKLFTFWNKLFLPKNLYTIFLSKFSANILKKYHRMDGPVIHNACPLTKEKILENIEYRKNKKENDRLVFLYIGRLDKHKGILTLLEAWSKVDTNDINLYVAGVGEYQNIVEEYAKKDSRVKYFGFVSGKEKEKLYRESDVLVFPSEWFEVSPITIQEAYGYGVPVLASDFGSIPEHIEIGKTGWVFKVKDSDDLAKKIVMICNHANDLKKFRENCFKKSLNNNISNYMIKLMYIHQQIVKLRTR